MIHTSITAGITNIVLDFLFIYVLKMGVFGAAVATATSQAVGGLIPLVYFISKNNSPLRLVKASLDLSPIMQSCINLAIFMYYNSHY